MPSKVGHGNQSRLTFVFARPLCFPPKTDRLILDPPAFFSDPVLVFLYFFLFFMASTAFCFFVTGEMAVPGAEKTS